ncbi:hypothetical protein DFH08DRAFT_824608 [Mycena albidolilacea]|uniref:Uncharacterized protein n=1 Tax=Mycena albidolilacea TaxID=1033008 RepID=A0AAD6Z486_9AGAR|nr:hypothetical protein DFH08DRAFT_824608 [Mycena albidolilacea]
MKSRPLVSICPRDAKIRQIASFGMTRFSFWLRNQLCASGRCGNFDVQIADLYALDARDSEELPMRSNVDDPQEEREYWMHLRRWNWAELRRKNPGKSRKRRVLGEERTGPQVINDCRGSTSVAQPVTLNRWNGKTKDSDAGGTACGTLGAKTRRGSQRAGWLVRLAAAASSAEDAGVTGHLAPVACLGVLGCFRRGDYSVDGEREKLRQRWSPGAGEGSGVHAVERAGVRGAHRAGPPPEHSAAADPIETMCVQWAMPLSLKGVQRVESNIVEVARTGGWGSRVETQEEWDSDGARYSMATVGAADKKCAGAQPLDPYNKQTNASRQLDVMTRYDSRPKP